MIGFDAIGFHAIGEQIDNTPPPITYLTPSKSSGTVSNYFQKGTATSTTQPTVATT